MTIKIDGLGAFWLKAGGYWRRSTTRREQEECPTKQWGGTDSLESCTKPVLTKTSAIAPAAAVHHDKAGFQFLDSPGRREAVVIQPLNSRSPCGANKSVAVNRDGQRSPGSPPSRRLCSDAGANPRMPVPHPLFSVTIGGTISVLVAAAAAILRTATIRRAVIASLFETVSRSAARRRL
jgi:hypothetical protein